ncbi:type VI secretion system tube protein Hcp [Xenorhabdus hominickii]|uniref:SciM protein n=1 Tax=Xenorhabdus hominickii TaxID=351679 RepID=A0A2G0Q1X9_XENHO|nr:type VI secretion system tube protein Hcp [Xenorhabdus hominickii]AOM40269.1 hypothetical protein A9255_06570 [Xenorhabdus hominickii]PHM53218.1 SciM protein [Xenorhabdus hominickii]
MSEMYTFVKFDDIEGESKTKGYEGWIGVLYLSRIITNVPLISQETGSWSGGKGQISDFTLHLNYDKSITAIEQYCLKGKHIPKTEIHMLHTTGNDVPTLWSKYVLTNTFITAVNSGSPSDSVIQVIIKPQKIDFSYSPVDYTGKPAASVTWIWDAQTKEIQ